MYACMHGFARGGLSATPNVILQRMRMVNHLFIRCYAVVTRGESKHIACQLARASRRTRVLYYAMLAGRCEQVPIHACMHACMYALRMHRAAATAGVVLACPFPTRYVPG